MTDNKPAEKMTQDEAMTILFHAAADKVERGETYWSEDDIYEAAAVIGNELEILNGLRRISDVFRQLDAMNK